MNRKSPLKEPHYSPIKFILEAKTNHSSPQGKFVPFSQERDGLGRLIKPQNIQQTKKTHKTRKESEDSDLPKLVHTKTPETCITLTDRVNLMEGQITKSFGFTDPMEVKLCEGNKVRIRKNSCPFDLKASYGIFSKWNDHQQYTHKEVEEKVIRTIQKEGENGYLKMVKSNSNTSLPTKTQIALPRQRRLTTIEKFVQKPQHQKSKQRLTKKNPCHKSVPKLTPLPPKVNPLHVQISSLESYKRWPRLNDNIEKNNEMFITKVWQSKKLAYQMQQSLIEMEDNM